MDLNDQQADNAELADIFGGEEPQAVPVDPPTADRRLSRAGCPLIWISDEGAELTIGGEDTLELCKKLPAFSVEVVWVGNRIDPPAFPQNLTQLRILTDEGKLLRPADIIWVMCDLYEQANAGVDIHVASPAGGIRAATFATLWMIGIGNMGVQEAVSHVSALARPLPEDLVAEITSYAGALRRELWDII